MILAVRHGAARVAHRFPEHLTPSVLLNADKLRHRVYAFRGPEPPPLPCLRLGPLDVAPEHRSGPRWSSRAGLPDRERLSVLIGVRGHPVEYRRDGRHRSPLRVFGDLHDTGAVVLVTLSTPLVQDHAGDHGCRGPRRPPLVAAEPRLLY